MDEEYKLLILNTGKMYVSEVKERTKQKIILKNPMVVDYKYSTENTPVFRYIPWQLLSDNPFVEIDLKQILMLTDPKIELLDIYQRINISFETM